MSIADSGPQLGRIDPSTIIGKAEGIPTSAVDALTGAMRQGLITADDVVARYGHHAKEKQKLDLQLIQEALSPQGLQNRAAQMQAGTSQAQLAGAQAGAALPMVPQQAAVAQTQLDEAQARQKYGSGVDDFRALAPLVPGYKGPPTKPDGSPDFDTMGTEGNYLKALYNQKLLAQDRLKPVEHLETTGPTGVKGRVDYNAYKEDVSPGSEPFKRYSQAAGQPLHFNAWNPAALQPGSVAIAPKAPEAKPAVEIQQPSVDANQPLTGADAQAAADRAEQGLPFTPTPRAGTPPAPPVQATQPAPAVPAVEARQEPASVRPAVGTYQPGVGVVTGDDYLKDAQSISDNFRKLDSYKEWEKAKPFAASMLKAAEAYNKIPIEKQRMGGEELNARDLQLAESVIKLYDPQGVVRQFKWDKIEKYQPWPDQLQNIISQVVNRGTMTPETRQAIIKIGVDNIRAREEGLIPTLEQAKEIADSRGIPIGHVLTKEEQKILSGGLTSGIGGQTQPQAGSSAASPVTLSTGKTVVRGPDGRAYIAQ